MNDRNLTSIQAYYNGIMDEQAKKNFEQQLQTDKALAKDWRAFQLYQQSFAQQAGSTEEAQAQLQAVKAELREEGYFTATEAAVRADLATEKRFKGVPKSSVLRVVQIYRWQIAAGLALFVTALLWLSRPATMAFDEMAYLENLQYETRTVGIAANDSTVLLLRNWLLSGETEQVLSRYADEPNKTLDIRLFAAQAHIQQGSFRQALPLLETIITHPDVRDKHKYRAMYDAALCQYHLGNRPTAITYLDNVIAAAKISPKELGVYGRLAQQKQMEWK